MSNKIQIETVEKLQNMPSFCPAVAGSESPPIIFASLRDPETSSGWQNYFFYSLKSEMTKTLLPPFPYGRKNEAQFVGFLPKFPALVLVLRGSVGIHTQPMHRFFGFFFTKGNLVQEISSRLRRVGFHIVRSNARTRTDELNNQNSKHRISWKALNKRNDGFAEFCGPLSQILWITKLQKSYFLSAGVG